MTAALCSEAVELLDQANAVYMSERDMDRAYELAQQAAGLAEAAGDVFTQARALRLMGGTSFESWHLDRAVEHLNHSVVLARESNNREALVEGLTTLAILQSRHGSAAAAVGLNHDVLLALEGIEAETLEQHDYSRTYVLARTHHNLAASYEKLAEYERAEHHSTLAVEGLAAAGDPYARGVSLSTLSTIQLRLGQAEKAVETASEALSAIVEQQGSPRRRSIATMKLGQANFGAGNVERAIELLLEARELAASAEAYETLVRTVADLGDVTLQVGDREAAVAYLEEARQIAEKHSLVSLELKVAAQLSQVHAEAGNFETAWRWGNRAWQLRESVFEQQRKRAITDAESRHRAEIYQLENVRLVKLNDELREARDTADAAANAKANFLAMLSHEIRTPLTGIIAAADLILASELEPEQQELTRVSRSSGELVLTIINDILDFSRLDAGKLGLDRLAFDLRETVEQTVWLLGPRAREKGLGLDIAILDPGHKRVLGDETRLTQVLVNLVGNAIKFTAEGTVSVRCVRGADEAMHFEVSDTGPGVGADPERLFQPFEQGSLAVGRRHGGTGLGLSIAKRLVEAMGGTIVARNNDDGPGACFSFSVPLPPAAVETRAAGLGNYHFSIPAGPRVGEPAPAGQRQILLVDDASIHRELLPGLFAMFGVACDVAATGEEAVSKANACRYDLILMDRHLPGIDGFEATAQIKRGPHGAVPIVAHTGTVTDETRAAGDAAGIVAYYRKPVALPEVKAIVARWLGVQSPAEPEPEPHSA